MAEARRRRSVAQRFLLSLLIDQLEANGVHPETARVVDLGGGTGTVASALAERGYRVLVVDPSPDALASLARRAGELGLADRLRGRQGDAADLADLVGEAGADAVVCHRVLEVVDSPAEALEAVARVLRPGGVLSLLVAQRTATVLGHALAGHLASARRSLADPSLFDGTRVRSLVTGAGLTPVSVHGIGTLANHVSEALVDSDAAAVTELLELEAAVSVDPEFQALAPQLHVLARRG